MGVRAPLDVDLEDRLVFGLTPLRFGYMALTGLSAMAVWGQRWVAAPLRLVACLPVLLLGAALGWGRWRGRGSDRWLLDLTVYLLANYSLDLGGSAPGVRGRR
jgi:hypothetical protein